MAHYIYSFHLQKTNGAFVTAEVKLFCCCISCYYYYLIIYFYRYRWSTVFQTVFPILLHLERSGFGLAGQVTSLYLHSYLLYVQFKVAHIPDVIFLESGRKPEKQEKTHADTERRCKTLLLVGDWPDNNVVSWNLGRTQRSLNMLNVMMMVMIMIEMTLIMQKKKPTTKKQAHLPPLPKTWTLG